MGHLIDRGNHLNRSRIQSQCDSTKKKKLSLGQILLSHKNKITKQVSTQVGVSNCDNGVHTDNAYRDKHPKHSQCFTTKKNIFSKNRLCAALVI